MTNRHERRAPRTPLIRLRRLTVGEIDPSERDAIIDQIYAIFSTYFAGHDRETFCRIALPTPETRLALLLTIDGALAGFASTSIQRLTIEGRDHAAVSASVFVLPAYRGGTLGAFFVLREILRFTARHPDVPIAYLGSVLWPTGYQRFARTFTRTYPNYRMGFPPEAARIARAFIEARGMKIEGAPPWVVNLGARPLGTARITPARANDPHVQYFCANNPGYVDGHALLMWIPIDRATIGEAFRGLLLDGSAEALNWLRGRARATAFRPPR